MLSYDDDNVGDWLAATTGDRLVLLPAEDAASAARIWASLGESAPGADDQGMRAVLDELTAGGLSRTPPFALLAWSEDLPATVRVIVRGSVRVSLNTAAGDVLLTGTGVSTWVERSVDGVTHVDVRSADSTDSADAFALPLERGMVRTRRLQVTLEPAGTSTSTNTAAAPASARPAVAPAPARIGEPPTPASSPAATAAPTTAPAPLAVPPRPTAVPAADEPASEQTITDIRPAGDDADTPSADAPATAAVESAPSDGYDHLFGATVMRGVEQAAVRPEADDETEEPDATAAAPAGSAADLDA
ncbi:MAG: hypothetical protein ABWY68_09485, partial [Cryobacterium sp.]